MGKRNGAAFHLNTWPGDATPADLMHFASKGFMQALSAFLDAERAQDTERMHFNSKLLRSVATRVDQYRRMRVRQWRAPRASSPKTTSPETSSAT